jgi:hypothetical protein
MALHLETVIAVLSLLGITLTGFWAYISKREASGANAAVNHIEAGDKPIYDMIRDTHDDVKEIREAVSDLKNWRASYQDGPLDSGAKVLQYLHDIDHQFENLERKIQKYGCPVRLGDEVTCLSTPDDSKNA